MRKGEIFFGKKGSDAIHPIVYLKYYDKNFFIGAMLTSSSNHADNILMSKTHFEKTDSINKKYKLYFKNSHFVKAKLLKKLEWAPFIKVGQLTNIGIKFIKSCTKEKDPVFWEQYLKQTKK
ncbi:MAG: hypothetical protein KAV41_02915 [Candidatus Pacebacteria bacterium]|nr:hypothetical protein [Candidatus Paceibacterota bacterium]